jgi:F-type H+-transporting ATPase subunit a
MLIIEGISHLARPLSLGLRLMGNMTGDHAVLAIFLGLAAFPVLFPIPILMLGTLVCIVQTLVFCLLSMVYIALAIEHSEEAH